MANNKQDAKVLFRADATPPETLRWHPQGAGWLVVGVLGVTFLVGFITLWLYAMPVLYASAGVMGAFLLALLAFLGLQDSGETAIRLSQRIGRSRPLQAGAASLLLLAFVLFVPGYAKVRTLNCAPLDCKLPGVQRFAIGTWTDASATAIGTTPLWTTGTRDVLFQKLNCLGGLEGIGKDMELTTTLLDQADLLITGSVGQMQQTVTLSASLSKGNHQYLQTVKESASIDEQSPRFRLEVLTLQNKLAQAIIGALALQIPTDQMNDSQRLPTGNSRALELNNQAVELIEHNQLNAAKALLTEALTLDPRYADAHNNLGRIARQQNDFNAAIASYKEAAELLPCESLYFFNLGFAYELAQQPDAAIQAYQEAIALEPSHVKALNNLGYVYLEKGDLIEALRFLQRGLQLDPNAAYLHKNLGRIYLAQNRAGDAIAELTKARLLSSLPYAEAIYYLALAYRNANQAQAACAALADYGQLATFDQQDDPERPKAAAMLAAELQCS